MALCFATLLGMKLVNSSIMDLIPKDAFNVGSTDDGPPVQTHINPEDVLAALQS
jgi:hypothetical protein